MATKCHDHSQSRTPDQSQCTCNKSTNMSLDKRNKALLVKLFYNNRCCTCTSRISPAERITEGSSFSACFAEHDEDDEERYPAHLWTCFVHLCRMRSCSFGR
ncbi:hypothetical protein C0J52_20513 [Blattella germanica]|nr:hypothetical protein C0J52_20513 [Blattella germanica]